MFEEADLPNCQIYSSLSFPLLYGYHALLILEYCGKPIAGERDRVYRVPLLICAQNKLVRIPRALWFIQLFQLLF